MMNNEQKFSRSPAKLVILYILITFFVLIIGIRYYLKQKEEIRNEAYTNLSVIGEMKANQISNWRNERIGDANVIFNNKFLLTDLKKWFYTPVDIELKSTIISYFFAYYNFYHYKNIIAFDTNAKVKYSIDKNLNEVSKITFSNLKNAGADKKPFFSEIYFCDLCKDIHLDIVIPLFEKDILFGGIILRVDPNEFLFPLIQTWPTKSESSETLLISRDGDEVVYLNELRHRKNTALKLRYKIDSSNYNIPSVNAVTGKTGLVEGLDYRGVPVLSDIRKIPESSWYMIAKVDLDEIYTPVQEKAINVSILTGMVLLSFAIGFIWVWTNQKKSLKIHQLEEERKHQALIKHFEYVVKYANEIFLLADKNFNIVEINQRALQVYGYSREEFIGLNIKDLRAPETFSDLEKQIEMIKKSPEVFYETIHKRKDGSVFPVEASIRHVEIDGEKFLQGIIRDISERKKSEELLRESEIKFRSLFENTILGIYRTTPDGQIIDCNPALLTMLGYDSLEDLTKRNLELDGFEPGYSRTEFRKKIETEGKIIGLESAWQKKDGTYIYVNENAKVVKNEDGKFLFYEGTVEDITERKKAEEGLRLKNLVFDASIAANSIADNNGIVTETNDAFLRLWGYSSKDEIIGKPITHFLNDSNEALEIVDALNKTGDWEGNYIARKKNGTTFIAFGLATNVKDGKGKIIGYQSAVLDVTEQKKAEESIKLLSSRNEAILTSVPDIIMEVDNNKVYTWANKTGIEFFGEDVIGKEAANYFEGEQETYSVVDPLFKGDENIFYVESWQKRKDGEKRLLGWWCRVLKDTEGNVIGALSSAQDITERKKAEQEIQENERKLREAQEMANLGYWEWNIKTGKVEWSEEVFKIFHLNPEKFTPQIDSILELSPWPEYHNRGKEIYEDILKGKKSGSYEQKFLLPDNSIGFYYSSYQGKFNENDELVSIVGTVIDITERKKTEEEIRKLNEELEQKVKERTKELKDKNIELIRMNKLFVGRELKMVELKQKIKEMEEKLK